MADTVSTRTILDGSRNAVVKLTNLSDGTGESLVLKIDAGNFVPVPRTFRVDRVEYDIHGMQVQLFWEGTPNESIGILSGFGHLDFTKSGGLSMERPGADGKILLSTIAAGANSSYTLNLHLKKRF